MCANAAVDGSRIRRLRENHFPSVHPLLEFSIQRVEKSRRRLRRCVRRDEDRQIPGHLAAFNGVDAHAFPRFREAHDFRRVVDPAAMRQAARPGEDRGDRIRRGFLLPSGVMSMEIIKSSDPKPCATVSDCTLPS
jgi:hypothetical protein